MSEIRFHILTRLPHIQLVTLLARNSCFTVVSPPGEVAGYCGPYFFKFFQNSGSSLAADTDDPEFVIVDFPVELYLSSQTQIPWEEQTMFIDDVFAHFVDHVEGIGVIASDGESGLPKPRIPASWHRGFMPPGY